MKKRVIIGLLFGLAALGAQNTQSSMKTIDYAITPIASTIVSYAAGSAVAGVNESFKQGVLSGGVWLSIARIAQHLQCDDYTVNSAYQLPKMVVELYVMKFITDLLSDIAQSVNEQGAFEALVSLRNRLAKATKEVMRFRDFTFGIAGFVVTEKCVSILYAITKAAFTKYCCAQ